MFAYTSPRFAAEVQGSHKVWSNVSVWRAGRLLIASLPISDGEITVDGEQDIPGEVTLTVPAGAGRELVPVNALDPLATFGQRLHISRGVTYPGPGYEQRFGGRFASLTNEGIPQGWFLITATDPDYLTGELKVTALSLERLFEDSLLTQPYQVLPGGTYLSEARRFVGNRAPFRTALPAGVTDRPIGSKTVLEGTRLEILKRLGAAWPARFRFALAGAVEVFPSVDRLNRTPVLTLRTGERGVVAKWDAPRSRDEIYNGVFARGEDEDAAGRVVEGYAVDNNRSSPTYWEGPFGQRPLEYSSPFLKTNAQAAKAARTMLARRLRRTRTVTVEMVPDPRIQLDDYIELDTPDVKGIGRVSGYKLPLREGTGTVTLDDMRTT